MIDLRHHFGRAYVINLDNRPDRWVAFQERAAAAGITGFERVRAIEGDKCPHPAWWRAGNGAWGCVLPGNQVQGRVVGASKSWYAGPAFEVVSASGNRVTLTANHPVLTSNGFIRTDQIRKGDQLLSYQSNSRFFSPHNDVDHVPSLIEEVFDSVKREGAPTFRKSRSNLDFYGDGEFLKGDVEIVTTNTFLLNAVSTKSVKCAEKLVLDRRHSDSEGFFTHRSSRSLRSDHVRCAEKRILVSSPPRFSHLIYRADCNPFTREYAENSRSAGVPLANRFPWRIRKFRTKITDRRTSGIVRQNLSNQMIRDFPAISDCRRFGSASELDSFFGKPAFQCTRVESLLVSELLHRFPSKVSLDEVIEIREFFHDGPVYDLSTDVGYFVAGNSDVNSESGIIVANCLMSHLRIAQDALLDDLPSYVVFEDDAVFSEDFADRLPSTMRRLDGVEWDMLYLGGQHLWVESGPPWPFCRGVVRCRNVNRTHAFAVSDRFMAQFQQHIMHAPDYIESKEPLHIDHQLGRLHEWRQHRILAIDPWVCGQAAGKSNINGGDQSESWWFGKGWGE